MNNDKNGKEIKLHDLVLVPEPETNDIHRQEFSATVAGFRTDTDGTELVTVVDGDNDGWDFAANRLTVLDE